MKTQYQTRVIGSVKQLGGAAFEATILNEEGREHDKRSFVCPAGAKPEQYASDRFGIPVAPKQEPQKKEKSE